MNRLMKKNQKKTKQFNKHWTQKHENYQKNMSILYIYFSLLKYG